jgi:sigma-B regulation protein RsbU (phosphoserine phosphatase)
MAAEPVRPSPGYTILIIDDDGYSQEVLKVILEKNGFRVFGLETGAPALPMATHLKPDLILLDLILPDIHGFDVCRTLQASDAARDIPIIFITGSGESRDIVAGLSIGGVDYIVKPYFEEEVLARIRVHLRLRSAYQYVIESQKARLLALRTAHRSFSTDLTQLPEARCNVFFDPAEEAGSDVYDVVALAPSVFGYLVADVAGHGIEASYISSAVKALFRENASLLQSPAETLYRINTLIRGFLADGQHVTAVYLVLNRNAGQVTVASAGHLPVVLQSPGGDMSQIDTEGDVLGVFISPVFSPVTISVPVGTRFWLYTDGVVEDFEKRRNWAQGLATLKRAIASLGPGPLDACLNEVCSTLGLDSPGQDDRLILVGEV